MRAVRPFTIAIFQLVFAALGWSQASEFTCPRITPKESSSGPPPDLCDKVYRVHCGDNTLSGFLAQVNKQVGILTALHGVVECRGRDAKLTAKKADPLVDDLVVAQVDMKRDLAFLISPSRKLPANLHLKANEGYENELRQGVRGELRVVGYPQSIEMQMGFTVSPQENPLVKLRYLLPGSDLGTYKSRNSPDIELSVLSLSGPIQPGFSGAPILDRNGEVVAVADGGLGLGSEIGWAIPVAQIEWKDTNSPENDFRTLSSDDKLLTSYVQPASAPALYFADSRELPGAVHKLQGGMDTEVYRRAGK
jgi:hypothetical protein